MPYEIIREPRGVHKRFWGFVTPGEFMESVRQFHNDPFFETIRYTINDFSAVEGFSLQQRHIEETAAINIGAAFHNPNITIIVVTADPAVIALARKYDELGGGKPVRLFAALADARAWMDVSL